MKYYAKYVYCDRFEAAAYTKKLQKTNLGKIPDLLAKRGCLSNLCESFGYF